MDRRINICFFFKSACGVDDGHPTMCAPMERNWKGVIANEEWINLLWVVFKFQTSHSDACAVQGWWETFCKSDTPLLFLETKRKEHNTKTANSLLWLLDLNAELRKISKLSYRYVTSLTGWSRGGVCNLYREVHYETEVRWCLLCRVFQ